MCGELEFLSGETFKTIVLIMPAEPQALEEENIEIVLERPKGGARLKVSTLPIILIKKTVDKNDSRIHKLECLLVSCPMKFFQRLVVILFTSAGQLIFFHHN